MHHDLKTWPCYYEHVARGNKTFELRENDRGFQSGDTVSLNEYDPTMESLTDDLGNSYDQPKGYTGQSKIFQIGYVLPVDEKRVVFSILKSE